MEDKITAYDLFLASAITGVTIALEGEMVLGGVHYPETILNKAERIADEAMERRKGNDNN